MCYYNRQISVEDALTIGGLPLEWESGRLNDRPPQRGFEYGNWPVIIWSSKKNIPVGWHAHREFLFASGLYRETALKRRGPVSSSGFYEWRHCETAGQKKDQAYPYFVTLQHASVFFMAGIWQPWIDVAL